MAENVIPTDSGNAQKDDELKRKRNRTVQKIALGFLLLALIFFLYWLFFLKGWESTDDAYVGGNLINVQPQVTAGVVAYYTDDTRYVEEGQLLVQLDPTDYQLAFEKAQANLALTVRQVRELQAKVQQQIAFVAVNKAKTLKAEQDFKNRYGLIDTNAIPKEDLEHAKADLEAQEAALRQSVYELEEQSIAAAINLSLEDHPLIQQAKVELRNAYLNLKRTSVFAPASGIVAMRNVDVGEYVKPDKILLAIVPLDQMWVDANFKEEQLRDVKIGQPAEVTIDMYGGLKFKGKVAGREPGSGSVFSLLPPQNATGNWIKIVQRVPVRIYLDQEQIKKNPLQLGLSAYTRVDVTDTSGPMMAQVPHTQKIASTSIYDIAMKEANELIDRIIEDNSK